MPIPDGLNKLLFGLITTAAVLFALSSCVDDDRKGCTDPDECRLYVRVLDTETGQDITAVGDTREVIMALFDGEGRFIATRVFSGDEIKERRPWIITDFDMDGVQVSTWGDLGGVDMAEPSQNQVGSDFVRLTVDSDGYSASPEDFFFGFERLGSSTRAVRSEEVTITQKNAKVHITVRGLTERDAEKYYFIIEAPQNGYDFSGNPNSETGRVRRIGEFNANDDLVSPLPYLMIHSADPDNVGSEDGAIVRLYRVEEGGDVEVAVAQYTDAGKYIGLYSGKTTNVLMDLSGTTSLEVRVEVTGWREVYQWSDW